MIMIPLSHYRYLFKVGLFYLGQRYPFIFFAFVVLISIVYLDWIVQ